jgi:nitrogen fixation NifU-like protein
MALTKLDQLYRAVILDHSQNPRHKGELKDANARMELRNPSCGDMISVQMKVEDGIVQDMAYDGYGCTISMSSASMMTEALIGKPVEEAMELANDFYEVVQGKDPENKNELGDATMLQGVSKFPTRIKCATISWKAFEKALKSDSQLDSGIEEV